MAEHWKDRAERAEAILTDLAAQETEIALALQAKIEASHSSETSAHWSGVKRAYWSIIDRAKAHLGVTEIPAARQLPPAHTPCQAMRDFGSAGDGA